MGTILSVMLGVLLYNNMGNIFSIIAVLMIIGGVRTIMKENREGKFDKKKEKK